MLNCDLPGQVIGVLVGAAGTGKSEVIAALLAFSVSWGRRDTIETLASQNCAALNVDGETMHSSRGMNLSLVSKKDSAMQDKVKKLVLIIEDEFSMMPQLLAGSHCILTRDIRQNPKPVGGLHLLIMGDPLQLPPVAAKSIYEEPSDKTQTASATAGYELWLAINWKSVLIEVWRQRFDQRFIGILDRTHYGVLTTQDRDDLLTQHVSQVSVKEPLVFTGTEYFSPMAAALNSNRCDFSKKSILDYCAKYGATIFQIMAVTSTPLYANTVKRFSYLNDDFTSKIQLLLSIHIGMNIMVTQKIPELKFARICTKGTMATVVGIVSGEDDNDEQFDIFYVTESRIKVMRYKKLPKLILLHIRGCTRVLVEGYPPGVIGIPPWHGSCKIDLPGKRSISPTLDQFPIISTYAMTPEKLQGITLGNYLFVSPLDRSGFSEQTLYVVLSRIASLKCLVITEEFDMEYLEQFRPPTTELLIMKDILENFIPPDYIPPAELARLQLWQTEQLSYCLDAIKRNFSNKHRDSSGKGTKASTASRRQSGVADFGSSSSSQGHKNIGASTGLPACSSSSKGNSGRNKTPAELFTEAKQAAFVALSPNFIDKGMTYSSEDVNSYAHASQREKLLDANAINNCFFVHLGT